jgi:hypothetical protein
MAETPTYRTLKLLRAEGHEAEVVEKWNPVVKRRIDLAGCMDVLAWGGGVKGVLAVQATTATNHAARRGKALLEPRLGHWLKGGNRFEVWSWRKAGRRWACRRDPISVTDYFGPQEAIE